MKRKNKLFIVVFLLLFGTPIYAQNYNLVVKMTNNSTQLFDLSDLRSIKFNPSTMIINENNNTSTSFNISDIDNYYFEENTSSIDQNENLKSLISIYPNPASEIINFIYESVVKEDVRIDILDMSGKIIKQLFEGQNQGEVHLQWKIGESENVSSGSYLCRITTNSKMITSPIIIK